MWHEIQVMHIDGSYAIVEVKAESEEEALEKAKQVTVKVYKDTTA
jgi:hypothetical protein